MVGPGPKTSEGPVVDPGPRTSEGPVVGSGGRTSEGPVVDPGPRTSEGSEVRPGPRTSEGPVVGSGRRTSEGPVVGPGPRTSEGPVAGLGSRTQQPLWGSGILSPVQLNSHSHFCQTRVTVHKFLQTLCTCLVQQAVFFCRVRLDPDWTDARGRGAVLPRHPANQTLGDEPPPRLPARLLVSLAQTCHRCDALSHHRTAR